MLSEANREALNNDPELIRELKAHAIALEKVNNELLGQINKQIALLEKYGAELSALEAELALAEKIVEKAAQTLSYKERRLLLEAAQAYMQRKESV